MLTFVAAFAAAYAGNGVTVSEATAGKGGKGTISIMLNNDDYSFTAFTFKLTLPEGLSFVTDNEGAPTFAAGTRFNDHSLSASLSGQTATFASLSLTSKPISGTSGLLLTVNIVAAESLNIGDELSASLSELTFTTPEEQEVNFEDVTFDVTVTESRVLLDETSKDMPEDAEDVDVRVNRTIAANVWNTLVLPFDMTAEQVKAAFGNDVQLADFTGVDTEEDADENIVGMTVNFQAITAIEANHPCLIKVSEAMNSFTVDGVDVEVEDEPSVDRDEIVVKVGKKTYYYYNSFIGTYVANTEVPELSLFLNGNNFWYSAGATKMKAYRAYFDFYDVLTEVEAAEAKIRFVIDDEVTSIDGIPSAADKMGAVYNLNGQLIGFDVDVNSLPAGVYIKNGQKIVVK